MRSFQDKMYNYEVTPPENIWEKINSDLDEQQAAGKISLKLYEMEMNPPTDAWEIIKTSLDTTKETIPVRQRRSFIIFRYAVAAILTGLIVFGAITLMNKRSSENKTTKNKIKISSKDSLSVQQENANNININSTQPDSAKDDAALEESKRTYAKLDIPENTKQRIRNAFMMTPVELISSVQPDNNYQLVIPENLKTLFSENDFAVNVADRYVQFVDCDGNIFRMSKKFADLSCCVSGEDVDINCKNQLQQWREKIACSSLAPSPGNFLDIVSLVQSLRDNNP